MIAFRFTILLYFIFLLFLCSSLFLFFKNIWLVFNSVLITIYCKSLDILNAHESNDDSGK